MATQADIPEDILHKKLELEDTSLTSVQFEKTVKEYFSVEVKKSESQLNESQEIQECQAESENKQVACSVQVEVTNNIVNGNSGTVEDESFLASPSGPTISNKEAGGREDGQVDEIKPSEVEVSETAKHLETGQKLEAVEETAREDEVIHKEKQKADQADKSLGQNVEEILNQQDSVDEGSRSSEKETKDLEKDERAGEEEDSHADLSSKEIPIAPEVTLDHKDVQSIAETCPKDEYEDNTSSTEATFLKKECTEEKIFEETKEEDKSVDLVLGGNGFESISSSDNKGAEDEKNQTHDNAGDASSSTAAPSCEESQNHETGENVKDEVERIALTDESVDQEAGVTEKEKHEMSRQEEDEAPTEHEMLDKDSSVTSFAAKAEETPFEVTREIQILEETTQVKGTTSGDVNTNERYEEGFDISPRNNEEDIHGKGEGQGITQAAVEEAQNTEGTGQVATEDISTVKLSQAEELTEVESIKHEDHPDDNLLPQNEPEEEKFQTHFNVFSEEIKSETLRGDDTTVIPVQEEKEIKSLDESFKEKEKKEEPIPSEEITNLPLTHSDGKIESTEVEVPENDANNSNATHVLVEQAEVQGEKIDKVPELESHEKDQTSDEASAKEEKHDEVEPEGYQSTEKTIVTSTEGTAQTEIILKESENTKDAENDFGMSSKEGFESRDAGENKSEEIKKEAEVTDVDVQKFTPSQESEESSTLDDIPSKVDSTVREIPEEEASKPIVEDETQKQESIVADFNKEQISERDVAFSTPESVQEGTSKSSEDNVKDAEKLIEEESSTGIIREGNINDLSLKNIQEDATATLKDHEHEAEKSKEEVLEELETVGAGESIPSETNKDAERIAEGSSVKQEEGQHNEGTYLDRTEASMEESKVETLEEEPLKSRGEDEGHTEENAEGNISKEQIIERDVTFFTPVSVQEETNKSSQDDIKDEENLNEEESIVEPKKEGKLDEDSPDNTREDATTALDREIEAEQSKEEIVEELEPSRAGESIPCETNKDVESLVDASSVKQGEEALEPKREDELHRQEPESNKEQITEEDVTFSAVESIQEETSITSQDNVKDAEKLNEEESTVQSLPENNQEDEIKKVNNHESEAEKCKEEVVQESEIAGPSESISFETSKHVEEFVEASPIKQQESQQEEGEYQDPIKASTEENQVQTPNEDVPKSKGEDESCGQESTVADFDKEEIVERDVTLSTPESIQEETNESSQDNFKDVDTIIEEHPAEVTKEGNIINLSRENVEEDRIEESKDHENEVEESKKEVVEEFVEASPIKQQESQQEEGEYQDPIKASIEENQVQTPNEDVPKSKGEDESRGQESTVADFDKEEIVERDVTLSTPESIQEETNESSQDNFNDVDTIIEEHPAEVTKEGNIINLSRENVEEDRIEESKDHENEVEESKKEVVEELETAGPGENVPCETNKDVEMSDDAPSVKREESKQEEVKYLEPTGASIEENKPEIPEEEASKSRVDDESQHEHAGADFDNEKIVEREVTFCTPEPIQEEASKTSQDGLKDEESTTEIVKEGEINNLSQENIQEDTIKTLKDHESEVEKSKEEVVEEFEKDVACGSIPCETTKVDEGSVDASSVKHEDGRQEESKYVDPNGASVEKNEVEISEEEASKSRGEGESQEKESTGADFDKEQIVGEEVLSTLESIREATSKSSQDNIKDAEKVNEETPVEITKEGDINDLSPENTEEEATEVLKDHENEVEISKDKVVQELETAGPSKSIQYETNEDVESSDVSLVKQEESQQEEGNYLDQVEDLIEENKFEDKFSIEVEKNDDENKVTVTEIGAELASKGEEDQQHAMQKEKPEEKLEESFHVATQKTETEKSCEISRELTCVEVEGTIQNLNENSETEKEGDNSDNIDVTNDSEKEIPKEIEIAGAGESSSVDALSVKQEERQQEEAKGIDQVESSTEKKTIEETLTAEVEKDDEENKASDASSKGEEGQQQATQKDEPDNKLENLLHEKPEETDEEKPKELEATEANESSSCKISEVAESYVDASSVTQEERQQEEVKYIDQVDSLTEENKVEDTISTEVVKEADDGKVEVTEKKIEVELNDEEDQQHATQKDKPEEKLEDLLHVTPEETETEPSTEIAREITSAKVEETARDLDKTSETENEEEKTKNKDVTNHSEKEILKELETVGADAESSVDASSLKQEESPEEEIKYIDQAEASIEETFTTEEVKDDYENKVSDVASKGEEDQQEATQKDEHEEKLENLLHVMPAETETETSTENARNITCVGEEGTAQNLEETLETEKTQHVDSTNDSEKEIPQELETAGIGESIPCKTNEELERSVVKQEEDKELDQVEALKEENKVEDLSPTEVVVKEGDDNEVKVTEREIEEDLQQALRKDELRWKLEDVPQVAPEETKTETSSGNATNITCVEAEGTIQDVEETSETESKEENVKSTDNAIDSEKEVLENSSAGQETREEVSREISSVDEFSHKLSDTETTEETKEEIVKESSKEVEKEEDESSESKEQIEEVGFIEETKPESLEDSAKPNEDICTTVTTEAPGEEKLAAKETQEKEPAAHDGSDSGSAGILAEQTSEKEAEPDDKEEVKSYEVALEEKGLEVDQVQSESVVLTEIASEETGWKEVKTEHEEKIETSDDAFEKKGLESSVDSVTREIVSEETCLKEAKPDNEEQIKSSDAASEEKGVSSSIDVGSEHESVSTGILSEEARLEEAEPDNEEQVKTCDIATEEKGLERSVHLDVQSDFASTRIESEEPSSKEAESETVEQVKSYDSAPEEKGLASKKDTEVLSEYVSTEILSAETSVKEVDQDSEDQVKHYDIAPEDKSLPSSLDVELVKEAEADKEDDDNKVKVTEREIEEDLKQVPQQDKPLEDVLQVTPKETETETPSENITSVEAEGAIQDVEKTSETENKEQNTKNTDNANDSVKEGLETTSAGPETREEVSREIGSLEEFSHKRPDTETTEETKEEVVEESSKEVAKEEDKSSESKELNDEVGLIGEIKPESLEDSAKPNEEEIVEESSKEIEKEEEKSVEFKEQIEEAGFTEEIQPESLEDSAKPKEDICTTVTTEAPEEEKLAAKETQEKEPAAYDGSDSGLAGILAEETSEKEAEPDDKEEVKSHEVVFEEKGLEVNQVQSESVVLTDIASAETGLKEVITDHEEKIKTSDNALEKEGLESSVDSVTREIVSEETCLKEAKPDDEEQITSSDAASEEKGVSSSIDVGSEHESVSTGILSQEARLKEAEPDDQQQVKTCDIATEEKVLERSIDVDAQSDFASTRIESEEPSSKEAESGKSSDSTPEEKGLASKKDAEVLSESVSTEILSAEISVKEADQDSEDQVKHFDIAPEDKSLPSSLDVELVKEAEADKEDDDNKVKVAEGEIEEDLQQAPQQEKLEEKLEDVLQVTPKETEKERSSGYVTSLEGEGAIQDVEKTSETENKEQNTKNTDNANDSVKEGLETTSGGPETREEVSRNIGSLEEFSHKSPDTETTEETKEEGVDGSSTEVEKEEDKSSESKDLNEEVGLIEELKPESSEDSAKPNEKETKEEIIEESSKEIEKEEDKSSESKEQIEEVGFIEEIKPESLEDSAKPNEDICTTVATEAPEEEKLAAKETQEKEPAAHDSSDSGSAGILADETSVKEAEPDDKEEVKSHEVALEEKGLEVDQVQSESVVLTEIASEETGWKEVITEHEEKIETSDDALERKGLESSVDSITREIASEETCLKEAKPDNEEQIKSSDAASEEKGVSSSIDVGSESESVSTGILSEEARLEEAEPDNEEQVKTCDIAAEEKGLERSVDVDLQSDFASTRVESEERSSKEDESETVEQIKSYDSAPEEKGLDSKKDTELQSESVSTEILSLETCVKEANQDRDDQVKHFDFASEVKTLASSLDNEIVNEETSLKEAVADNEEHVKSDDVALEKEGPVSDAKVEVQSASVSAISEETVVKEVQRDHEEQVSSSNIAFEETSRESSVDDTRIVSEETSSKEVQPDDEEEVKDIASEKESLVTGVDTKKQPDVVSAGIESEGTCLKEDKPENDDEIRSSDIASQEESLVSEETSFKEAELDTKEEVKTSYVASKEGDVASNVNEQSEYAKSEENEEKKVPEVTGEFEEKIEQEIKVETPIAGTETKEHDTKADTSLEGSSGDILKDSSAVPSKNDEPVTTEESERSNEEIQKQRDVEITTKDAIPTEVHDFEQDVENESSNEHVTDKEINLNESHPVSTVDERVYKENDSGPIVTEEVKIEEERTVTNLEEAQPLETKSEERNLVSQKPELDISQAQEVESVTKLEVRSFDLDQVDEKETEGKTIAEETSDVNEVKETKLTSGTEDVDAIRAIPAVEKPETVESKEDIKEVSECQSVKAVNEDEITSDTDKKTGEEGLLQEEDGSKLEFYDTEKKIASEEIQKQKDEELSTPPEVTVKDAITTEVHEGVEKAVENESRNEHVTDREINLNESHPVSIVNERVYEENDSGPIVTEEVKIEEERTVTNLEEAQPLETKSEERNLVSQKSEHDISQAEEVESVTKLEERSFDLDQVDEKETEGKTIAEETSDVTEVKETKLTSGTEDVDATGPIPAVEKPETVESKEEIKEVLECQSVKAVNEDEITSEQAPGDGISKGQGHESETMVETKEETIKDVDHPDNENIEASSAVTHLETEEPSGPKLHEAAEERLQKEETEEDTKIAPEPLFESSYESIQAVSTDEVTVDRDHHVGVSTEQVQELQTTEVVKKTEDSLVAEKAEEKNLKEETEEEITEAPITVSIEDQALPAVTLKDELQVSLPEEQNSEKTSHSSATKTTEEECLPKEEPREIKASVSLTDVSGSNETQEETKDASKTVFASDSQSIVIVTEDKKVTCETFPENSSEVQLLEQSYVLLPKEQEEVVTTTAKEIEEKTTEETFSQEEVEDIMEASETVSKENSPDTEVVSRDTYTDRALPVDKYEIITDQALKVPSYSTTVSDEQGHDTAATDKKSEEKETEEEAKLSDDKNAEDSCGVKTVEEPKKIEVSEPKKIEPQESEGGKRDTDSQSEHDEVSETREAVEKREIASELVTEKVDSPEAFTSIEEVEIIENHLKVATTDSRTEEPQGETTIQAEKTTEKENADKQELSREISESKGGLDVTEVQETESSDATCKESLETRTTTSDKEAPSKLTNPVEDETSQTAEPKDAKPENVTSVSREIIADVEIKEEECEEKETGGSKTETKPAVVSLSELMQSSIEETARVAEHSAEAEKAKTDEEEEEEEDDEHEREREEAEHPDAPILVQASKEDSDHKGGRKKSHGLFSGVGSKVKHSISKVKKAITGKSSHSKTLPST